MSNMQIRKLKGMISKYETAGVLNKFSLSVLPVIYSQSTLCTTSVSKNENMNIQIPPCNVRHLNGILKISLEM